jgi:hypothetical protein
MRPIHSMDEDKDSSALGGVPICQSGPVLLQGLDPEVHMQILLVVCI